MIVFVDLGDKAVALRMHGLEVTGSCRVIFQCLAQPGHRLAECGFADHRVAPHCVHQLLPRHEPVAVGNQVNEELQDDRLKVNLIAILAELPRVRIYKEVIETINMMLAHYFAADRIA